MSMIKGEQLMSISWDGCCKAVTATKLNKPLQLGQFEVHGTTPPTTIHWWDKEGIRKQSSRIPSKEWLWSQDMPYLVKEKTTMKMPHWQEGFYLYQFYITSLTSIQRWVLFEEKKTHSSFPSTFHITNPKKESKDYREEAVEAKLQGKQHCWREDHVRASSS